MKSDRSVVLITGASRGLGKALAFEYARRGYDLMLCSRNAEALRAVVEGARAYGARAEHTACDVSDLASMENAVGYAMEQFGRIDIAILNAGIGGSVRFSDFDRETFENVMRTNLTGTVNGIVALVPIMKHQGSGTIVGMSSLADIRPIPGNSPYVASKAALTVVLEAAAMELKPYGIKVITVRPGFIETDMTSQNTIPMPMIMTAEKAAGIIVRGIKRNRSHIAFPKFMWLMSFFSGVIPHRIWRYVFRIRD